MKSLFFTFAMLAFSFMTQAQELYFPPSSGDWETVSPDDLGWCSDSIDVLQFFLDEQDSKAFILLKDGKIAMEFYFDEFTQDSLWYWASAGKSLEAFLIGCAQEDGFLDINDPTSDYLGEGWTNLSAAQEAEISIWNQLTMTTGLDDTVLNSDCTDPECLEFLEAPGERWAYHNAPYTLLSDVLTEAVGLTPNLYIYTKLTVPAGLDVYYVPLDYNQVAFSTPRDMAKFGLLSMNRGTWDEDVILGDEEYFNQMITPSQTINPAYGYLWWLNGQSSYMLPGLQLNIPGSIVPNAPPTMVAAIGKNNQIINIVEEEGLVWIRMGEASGLDLVPTALNNEIWTYLNQILCSSTDIDEVEKAGFTFGPNPCAEILTCTADLSGTIQVIDQAGKKHFEIQVKQEQKIEVDLSHLKPGIYLLRYINEKGTSTHQLFVD